MTIGHILKTVVDKRKIADSAVTNNADKKIYKTIIDKTIVKLYHDK